MSTATEKKVLHLRFQMVAVNATAAIREIETARLGQVFEVKGVRKLPEGLAIYQVDAWVASPSYAEKQIRDTYLGVEVVA